MAGTTAETRGGSPRGLGTEVLLVLGVSLGASAVYAVVRLADRLTRAETLASQSTTLNASVSDRPWLDLLYQLLDIGFTLVPAALALFLLGGRSIRAGARVIGMGLHGPTEPTAQAAEPAVDPYEGSAQRGTAAPVAGDVPGGRPARGAQAELRARARVPGVRRRPAPDTWRRQLGHGVVLFAVIGAPGLAFYALGRAAGLTVAVQASGLSGAWWTVPVLALAALKNGLLEEVVVVGYLVERLETIGWSGRRVVVLSAVLRGCYHLYQGVGPGIGNLVMGLVMAGYYRRTRRTWPLVVAHSLLDVVAFVGYAVVPATWLAWLGLT